MAKEKTQSALVKRELPVTGIDELMRLSEILFKGRGSMMPNVDRPEKVFAIVMAGMEIGLSPNQSLDSIMMSQTGRLTIWGDGALALVKASGLLESIEERREGSGEDRCGVCVVKRFGEEPREFRFSIADKIKAGLGLDKQGNPAPASPWAKWEDRMLTMRPRTFALRDVFPDVLRGLQIREEVDDYESSSSQPSVRQTSTTAASGSAEASATVATVAGELMITDDQITRIGELRKLMITSKGLKEAGEIKAEWSAIVASAAGGPFKSAKEMTAAQAEQFITDLEKLYCPFSSGGTTATVAAEPAKDTPVVVAADATETTAAVAGTTAA